MHEWALAESVIKTAVEHSGLKKLKKLKEAGVVFGELQAIDKEIFIFALDGLRGEHPAAKDCRFKVTVEPAVFRCKACAKEFPLKGLKKTKDEAEFIHFVPEMAHTFLKCPRCKSPDFEITAGRGVGLSYIKGSK
ncbi:MAG: hydrogenase nickel insertion protein HypA [Elusimicrobia bacterium CG08_land_8_20_14_0_20_59_10]|nr:MAG: hydrogenase nickel insertion protein HypA [Elusimicrobia bacterium CG08_land_8_20_14_0_20_59_10]